MDRLDLVAALMERVGLTRAQAVACLDTLTDTLADAMRNGSTVRVGRLMTVTTVERAERAGRNPRTGEAITIAARTAVKITPGSALTNAVKR